MEALAAGGSSLVLRRGASLIRRSSSAASSATTVLASPGENDDPQHGGAVAAKPPQPTPDTAPAILEQSPSKLRRRAALPQRRSFGRVREPKPAAAAPLGGLAVETAAAAADGAQRRSRQLERRSSFARRASL